jgi:hypothetical protein
MGPRILEIRNYDLKEAIVLLDGRSPARLKAAHLRQPPPRMKRWKFDAHRIEYTVVSSGIKPSQAKSVLAGYVLSRRTFSDWKISSFDRPDAL